MIKAMKKTILLFSLFFFTLNANAQNESSWWIFGDVAGVEFTPNPQNRSLDPAVTNSLYNQDEGVASIADENGNLLFFTNGRFVYNRNGNIMPNGTGLLGSDSSSQSAIIVKAPETANVYFIFTVGAGGSGPLAYSRVEMNLNNGLGDVVPGVKNIILLESCAEKVAATIKTGSNNAYVSTFAESNATSTANGSGNFNALFVWEVRGIAGAGISFVNPAPINQTANGNQRFYNTPVASSNGDRGMLRFSPDGTKLAIATQNFTNQGVTLYDFNPGSGQVSGSGLKLDNGPAYGVEFSPSSQYLYHDLSDQYGNETVRNKRLIQYDLCDQANIIASRNQFANITGEGRGTLQLARDGKIYVARFGFTFLGSIDPETTTPVYVPNAIDIAPGISRQGLPVFIQSRFSTSFTVNDQCQGDATEFILACLPQVAASNWDFGDGNVLSVVGPGIVRNTYASAGSYDVTVNVTNVSGNTRTFSQTIRIFENGVVDPIDNTLLDYCDADGSGNELIDLTAFTSDVLGTQSATTFDISYHATAADADNDINPLPNNHLLPLGTTQIWVRISNNTSPVSDGCSAFAPIDITVSTIPTAVNIPPIELCDNNADGTESFNLGSQIAIIDNAAGNPVDVAYTLFTSQANADMDMNPINTANLFANTTNPQTIYVRLQNTNDVDCFSTATFQLLLLAQPVIGTPANIDVCDDVPLDGRANFMLTDQDSAVTATTSGTVTYHASQMDADTGNAPLVSPYSVTGTQRLYARLLTADGCFNTTSFAITVEQAPAIGNAPDLTNICDGNTDLNQNVFDLSVQDIAVLNGLNPADYTISYYTTDSDAQNEVNELPINYSIPFQAGVSTDVLHARLENNLTGCFNTSVFTIIFERCEIIFPEGFSPNNDGINDTFEIPGLAEQFPNFELQIMNRLGNMVYSTRANNYVAFAGVPNTGLFSGDGMLPAGTYFYVIKYNDPDKPDTASWVYINY
jgi:gliding motility-associated-like protein